MVEIKSNPYQGLKPGIPKRGNQLSPVEIKSNPYQGLKLLSLANHTALEVEIKSNPYQGLKLLTTSWLPRP